MPLFLVVLGAVLGVVGSGAILLWWNSHQLPIVSGGYSLYHRSERGEMRADTALWKTVLYDDLRNCRITTTILTSPEGMSVAEDSFKILTLKILIRNDGRSAATNLKLSFAAHFFDLDFVGIRPHVPHAYSTSKDTLLGIFEHSVELTSLSPGDEKFLTFSAHLDNKEVLGTV